MPTRRATPTVVPHQVYPDTTTTLHDLATGMSPRAALVTVLMGSVVDTIRYRGITSRVSSFMLGACRDYAKDNGVPFDVELVIAMLLSVVDLDQ